MTRTVRLAALGLAAAVNVAVLAAIDAGMVQITERERLAQQQPERIVVTGRAAEHAVMATQNCPAPKVL